ncbi:hypothetical protein PENTCL1PPCAC_29053, partial [Pristionchus entomophagus]
SSSLALPRRIDRVAGSPALSFMPCVPRSRDQDRDSPTVDNFNPQHGQYTCCFQNLHAQRGSMIIALFHIILALIFFILVIKSLGKADKSLIEGIFQILVAFVLITANLVFLIGLRIEHRHIVSFFICFQTCLICVFFALFLMLILGFKTSLFRDPPIIVNGKVTIEQELVIVMQIFVALGTVFVEVWFLTVILKSFRYLNDKYHFNGSDSVAEV